MSGADGFSERVAYVFGTQVFSAAIGTVTGFLLARLLGPSGKGEYYLIVLLPTTIMVLIQLGLPQAFSFYAARGQVRGAIAASLTTTVGLSLIAFGATLVALPTLSQTVVRGPPPALIGLGLLAIPLTLNATMTTDIVIGRQAVRSYALVQISYSLCSVVLVVLLVGVLGVGVSGAVAAFLLASAIQAGGFLLAAIRVTRRVPQPTGVTCCDLFRFGLPLYPGSLAQFFSYRADVYLLAWLLASPSVQLGYYSLAVSLAEMVFFVSNAVAALYFPRVAGSSRATSDREVAAMTRVTLELTAAAGLALVPAAAILVVVLLPAFVPSLSALYVLLPGVVALSVAKVLSGYLSGLGMTGLTSAVNASGVALNVIANVLLIPHFGIVGAASASLLSYSATSIAFTVIVARLAGASRLEFWIPRVADARLAAASVAAMAARAGFHYGGT